MPTARHNVKTDKDFKMATIKMFQEAIMNTLETNERKQSPNKETGNKKNGKTVELKTQ